MNNFIVCLKTKPDVNGNSRRVYIVYETQSVVKKVLVNPDNPFQELKEMGIILSTFQEFEVSPKEFNRWKKTAEMIQKGN